MPSGRAKEGNHTYTADPRHRPTTSRGCCCRRRRANLQGAGAGRTGARAPRGRVQRSNRPSSCSMLDASVTASTVFRCARVCSKYWSDATHPHTLDATPLSRYATLPQVPRYGVHERSEHGGLERVQRTFRTGCVRCSQHLRRRPLHSRCSSSRTALSEYPIRPRAARRAPAWITAGEARDVSSRDLGELSSDSRCRWDPLGNRINRNLG